MYDRDEVRILTDAELNSDSAKRLQSIEWRLVRISERLIWIAVPLWILALIGLWHLH